MASENKALAAEAKKRGNDLFAKKTKESYEQALCAYQEAIELDPEEHVYYGNSCACHLELASETWEPRKKVEHYAKALSLARDCTARGPAWLKGYIRQSTAEFELIAAVAKWEERKIQDEKWRKEDEERAERDRKEGREPFAPPKREEAQEMEASLKTIIESVSHSSCEASCRKGLELEADNAQLRSRLQSLRDAGHATDAEKDREMRNQAAAAEQKAQGNAAFTAKKWKDASDFYTKALEQDPFDHVFYSNRSACFAELEDFDKALRDAESCIALNPKFAKGYSRHAHALFHLGRYVDMEATAKAGLAMDPSSAPLQEAVKQAEIETREPLEVQKHMHKLRRDKRQDAKMQDLMKGLNMAGQNIQMFSPGDDLSGLLGGLGGGGGGMGGFGGGGKARMTEEQMRGMARAMAQAPTSQGKAASPSATAAAPAKTESESDGPTSFGPKL